MQRIAPSDKIPLIRVELERMLSEGKISKAIYDDAVKNLHAGLTDPSTEISSGGTTSKEIYSLCGDDGKISLPARDKFVRKLGSDSTVKSSAQRRVTELHTVLLPAV